MIYFLLVVLN